MNQRIEEKFAFSAEGLPAADFAVARLQGSEGLCRCYDFAVTLVGGTADVDLTAVVGRPGRLSIRRPDGADAVFHGIVTDFAQLGAFGGAAFYRANLKPRLHRLSLTCHSQVFLGRSVPEFVADSLTHGGLTTRDFTFRLQHDYSPLETVCQYNESHLAFVTRWLARKGMVYYFEQGADAETLVITDSRLAHAPLAQGARLRYAPPSGLATGAATEEAVFSWNCRHTMAPAEVLVKDYNHRTPSLDVSGDAPVSPGGHGRRYVYGPHVRTPEQARRTAVILAETARCGMERFRGKGSAPFVSPGFTFTLTDHPSPRFNQDYLILDVDHEGDQTGYLADGLWPEGDPREVFYRNRFTAIAAGVQYRPAPDVPWPRIAGALPATVDAAGSGAVAELDERGRYKVILPFDLSGRKDGKASAWVRMATPYAGDGHGMHFPLHKGAEVLLAFTDGDPDRPVIVAAVPNAQSPPVVTGANQTMAAITTASGTKIHMEDKAGSERILMHVPKQESFIRVGAHNDPPAGVDTSMDLSKLGKDKKGWGIAEKTDGVLDIQAKIKNEIIAGFANDIVLGIRTWFTGGARVYIVLGPEVLIHWPVLWRFHNLHREITETNIKIYLKRLAINESRNVVVYGVQNVVAQCETNLITNQEQTGILDKTRALENTLSATLSSFNSTFLKARTNDRKITAQLTGLSTIGAELKSVGQEITTAGTVIISSDLDVENTADNVQTAGTKIQNAGILLQGAPLITI